MPAFSQVSSAIAHQLTKPTLSTLAAVGLPLRLPESLELRMTYITRSWHKLLMSKAPCLSTCGKCASGVGHRPGTCWVAWGVSHRPSIWSHLLGCLGVSHRPSIWGHLLSCLGRQSQTKHWQSFAGLLGASVTMGSFAGLLGASVTDQALGVICWVAWGVSHSGVIC